MTTTDRGSDLDRRVAVAIEHWGPRFVAQGVDLSDFNRTVARITRWSEWCGEWGRTGQEHEAAAEAAEAAGHALTAAEAWRRAALCWHFGKFGFVEGEAQARAASRRKGGRFQR